jgi:putative ABC transport system ATP-binding protein
MNVLSLVGVSRVRGAGRQAVQALANVSLALEAGELVVLQGPSGSGKTTLLVVAAGLLTPDSGEVYLTGRRLDVETHDERRRLRATRLGFVFQRGNLIAGLSARENVLLQAAMAGMDEDTAVEATDELFDALGIAPLADRRSEALSGGEEQRVALARALVHRPAVVLADEPTANLDGTTGRTVAGLLSSLAGVHNAAVLIASHDVRLEPFATRRISIADGRIGEGHHG